MKRREIRSERLLLRAWVPSDRLPFAQMNADPQVVQFLPSALTCEQSNHFADRIEAHFDTHGFGLWAVEVCHSAPFIGFVGLSVPSFESHFTPCVEIGWRLAKKYWGRGYATEAARAVLAYAFEDLGQEEVVSFTVPGNLKSRAVMQRLGMTYAPEDDFDHPSLEEGHRLRRHVLHRILRSSIDKRGSEETGKIGE